ncbi:MAG: ATP-binding protein [Acidobacteriota bacterium]
MATVSVSSTFAGEYRRKGNSLAGIGLAGTGALALITFAAFRLELNLTAVAFLHLMVIVFVARQGGFGIASALSAMAVACQLYFFVPPLLAWTVADPRNWVALVSFEYCALVVSRLSARAVHQTQAAEFHRREMEGLYETSRLVLLMDRRSEPGPQLTAAIHRIFHCRTVALFDGASAQAIVAGEAGAETEKKTRDAYLRAKDWFDGDQTWIRVLRTGTRPTGALALRGGGIGAAVADALALLVAVALERSRSFEIETRAEAGRQSEQLRTAVLDALAHDVKTPLTAIRTASSGLLEAGASLSPWQAELIGLIDEQAGRINELTDHLLHMARLDAKELRLQRTVIRAATLLDAVKREAERHAAGRSLRSVMEADNQFIRGDEQLLTMALTQVIDNALKYAAPSSEITLGLERRGDEITLSVHNFGEPVPPADMERIFERFYRAPGTARRAAGTGLGLAITRKIVAAHGGRVWAASDEIRGTTFFLAFPEYEGSTQ